MTREEAIERIKMILEEATANEDAVSYVTSDDADALSMAIKALECEPLTDKEQRIFLAAISREEKVCKEVEENYPDDKELYKDSLVAVCRSIERKVKKALWS